MGGEKHQPDQQLTGLRESQERLRALVEMTSDWIWEVDARGVYTYSSPKVRDLLGYEPHEIVGRTPFDLMTPEDAACTQSVFQNHVESRIPLSNLENRCLHRDGQVVVLEMSALPMLDAGGRLRGYRGVARDVSKGKQAEQSLRTQHELAIALSASLTLAEATEHMLRAAFHLEGVDCGGVYIVDRQSGQIHLVHQRGLSESFIAANSHYAADSPHAQIIQSGAPIFAQYSELAPRMDEANHAEKLRAIAVVPIRYRAKVVAALNLASHTVDSYSDSVRSDIVALAAQMGGAVYRVLVDEERHRLEAQVQSAQKLESLGVLAGGIAHDFNNLLTGILGNASLVLADLPVESPARSGVMDIETTAKRAADLVRQLLAYSGKGKLVVERITLSALVAEMVHLLEVSISKNANLVLDLDGGTPPVEADATQVRQIVLNLITNASEALGGESGMVTIRTGSARYDHQYLRDTYLHVDLEEGIYSHIEISDSGCGMDRETVSRIFDPFFTTKFAGRGLGLAAVLGIVRGHQGAINVYSEVGKGTTIKVLFPAVELQPGSAHPPADDTVTVDGAGRVVLLVDDEETVRTAAGRMLARLGFEVAIAQDGQEAIELFKVAPERFGLVLLDLTMPKMGGETCFHELRNLHPEVCVVLSSGHSEQELTARFAGKGVNGFIQKPYQLATLQKVLRDVLVGPRATDRRRAFKP